MEKFIEGYEGLYSITDDGRIFSHYNGSTKKFRIMERKQFMKGNGYMSIALGYNGSSKTYYVHRLVAETFISGRKLETHEFVLHLDDNKRNNSVNNLMIGNHAENMKQAKDRKRFISGEHHHFSKVSDEDFIKIVDMVIAGNTLKYIGDKFGLSFAEISRIRNGKIKRDNILSEEQIESLKEIRKTLIKLKRTTPEQVIRIFELKSTGMINRNISKAVGVSEQMVGRIIKLRYA